MCPIPEFAQGVKDFSVPVGLEARVRVDLVVVGSVAVSERGEMKKYPRYWGVMVLLFLNFGAISLN